MLSFHQSDQDIRSAGHRRLSGVAQEYKSCLLSGCVVFHAGERGGECTHTQGIKKKEGNKTTQNGKKSNKHTSGGIRIQH